MDQDEIEIITVNNRNSAEIEEPAGAAVGEAFNAHEGSEEADSGSEPQNLNYTTYSQQVQSGERKTRMTDVEREIRTLAKVKGLEPTQINLWKVAFEHYSERYTRFQNRIYKSEEEIRSVKNEIYQVVGFFSAFQGLLITAAPQSVLLRCNNVRFIFALSAFATAVAVFGIWKKIRAMAGLRFANNRNKHYMKEIRLWPFHLQDHGMDFHFDNVSHLSMPFSNSCMWWKEILVGYGTLLVVSVIAFGGLCMVAMCQIVCNPGHSLPSN